ncbi:A/G-specific adenine glycosylase [Bifidobacterium aquikefiricola]|uniref:Adenine DNA glycosylase n=1 Tax=Bifidobacterium aquikefiricola TaxID=3059038 RepID=A0AB39U4W9_9BIFI
MTDLPLDSAQVDELKSRLFPWWDHHARDLPWRFGRTTPWGILVSEVMSQQTQMSRVAPYWTAWMRLWPDARALANASTAEVITAWGRLGYPRRALRLQACARAVNEQYGNHLPHSYEELIALPGIGDYTASAVLSFAFGTRIAVIDTNIRRVLSRAALGIESLGGAASAAERKLANELLPHDSKESEVWNQATMELGATICTAKNPQCEICPLSEVCNFVAAGKPGLAEGRTRPQQHFKGTNRQVRGLILSALRSKTDASPLSYQTLVKIWPNSSQLDECLASLDDDGLIELMPDKAIQFPK